MSVYLFATLDTKGREPVAPVPGAEMREEDGRITCRYDPDQTDVNAIIAAVMAESMPPLRPIRISLNPFFRI